MQTQKYVSAFFIKNKLNWLVVHSLCLRSLHSGKTYSKLSLSHILGTREDVSASLLIIAATSRLKMVLLG